MKYSDLIKYKGGEAAIAERSLSVLSAGAGPAQIASIGVSAGDSKAGKLLGIPVLTVKAGGADGLWIPYIANRTIYDYVSGGQSWVASGPFSGCYFEVGTHGGRTYAAHISCEGKNDPNVAAWDGVLPGRTVLFRAKIGMALDLPVGARNVAAVVFANIAGGAVEATRVDVQTKSAGGMSGPIFNVQAVASAG
jgi:hypothetical protein